MIEQLRKHDNRYRNVIMTNALFGKNNFVDFGQGVQPAAKRGDRRLSRKCEQMRDTAAI
jgi:hypothetical protein